MYKYDLLNNIHTQTQKHLYVICWWFLIVPLEIINKNNVIIYYYQLKNTKRFQLSCKIKKSLEEDENKMKRLIKIIDETSKLF